MPVELYPRVTFNGKTYWQINTVTLVDIDPEGQTIFFVGTPAGGIANTGPLVQGDPGKHSIIDPTVVLTVLEYGDPTPDSVSWEELVPGSDTTSQVVREHRTIHKGAPGANGTTSIDLASIGGTAVAGKLIKVNAGATGFDFTPQKVGDRYYASSITSLSSSAAGTLGTVGMGPFDIDVRIECQGSAIVTGSASDVQVDLLARMGSTSGVVIGRGMGIAAAAPVAATRLGPDLLPADITAGGSNYDKLAAGATTTIYFRAERLAGSGTFSISNTRASFWAKANPIP